MEEIQNTLSGSEEPLPSYANSQGEVLLSCKLVISGYSNNGQYTTLTAKLKGRITKM